MFSQLQSKHLEDIINTNSIKLYWSAQSLEIYSHAYTSQSRIYMEHKPCMSILQVVTLCQYHHIIIIIINPIWPVLHGNTYIHVISKYVLIRYRQDISARGY